MLCTGHVISTTQVGLLKGAEIRIRRERLSDGTLGCSGEDDT
jgi:hypothetical protein